jgi:hypothetical protein
MKLVSLIIQINLTISKAEADSTMVKPIKRFCISTIHYLVNLFDLPDIIIITIVISRQEN